MPEYGRDVRCRRDGDGWVFEASRTEWSEQWPDHHAPAECWLIVRRWKTEPDEARLARARAYAQRRYFRTCTHCGQVCNLGYMHDKETCMVCAAEVHGVIY